MSTTFGSPEVGWVILSSAEARIKAKIEEAGIPLKEWDIQINYGIKTGFNEAFIIDGKTKDELIRQSPNSAEIIRPVLRGRDIKRYRAVFGERWIINTHNGVASKNIQRINVEVDYPSIFTYLNQSTFKPQIEIREDQGVHWSNLRNCAYLEEFEKDKLVWLEISDVPKFCLDDKKLFVEATAFFLTGSHLHYLLCILNSKIVEWYLDKITASTGAGTNRWKKIYLEKIPIPEVTIAESDMFRFLTQNLLLMHDKGLSTKNQEVEITQLILRKYNLTPEESNLLLDS